MYRLINCLSLLLLISVNSHAATEFEGDIPSDLVKIFMSNSGMPSVTLYSDLSDAFSYLTVTDEFEVLGSVETGYSDNTYLKTDLPFDQAKAVLFDPLMADGWIEIVSYMQFVPETGFVNNNLPETTTNQICHDDFGNMTIRFSSLEDANLVTLLISNQMMMGGGVPTTCAQQNEQQSMAFNRGMGMNAGVRQYMPTLEIPEEADIVFPAFGGFSGSNNDAESKTTIPIDWAISEVYSHFAEQLEAQGWNLDSDWEGSIFYGGNWTKSPEENVNIIGILSILNLAEDSYQMSFRILYRGPSGQSGSQYFINAPIRAL